MADISKIKLPSGSSYDIKDAWSRQEISSIKDTISGALVFCGETTTEISEGATTSPVTIKTAVKIRGVDYAAGASYTPVAGDVFVYGKVEYAFNGTSWFALGDLNLSADFGALAFKDSATGSATYTPAGSVTGSFTGASMTSTGKYTPQGSVSLTGTTDASTTVAPAASGDATYTPAGTITGTKFTGTELTSTGSFQPTGTVAIDTSTATHPVSTTEGEATYTPAGSVTGSFTGASMTSTGSYQPAGSVSAPSINVATAGATDTIHNPTSKTVVVNADAGALASLTTTVADEELTIGWDAGTLPSFLSGDSIATSDVTVKTGDAAYTADQPTFTGTTATIEVSGTTAGSLDGLGFSGTGVRLVTDNIVSPISAAFTGTEGNVSVTGTPAGEISAAFTGTGVRLETGSISVPTGASFTGTEGDVEVSGTTAGSVTGLGFTGTEATISITAS